MKKISFILLLYIGLRAMVCGFTDINKKPYTHYISNEEAKELYTRAIETHYPLKEFRQARILLDKVYKRSFSDLRDESLYYIAKTYFYENKYSKTYEYLRRVIIEFPQENVMKDKLLLKTVGNIVIATKEDLSKIREIEIKTAEFNFEIYTIAEKIFYCIKMVDVAKKIYKETEEIEKGLFELLGIDFSIKTDTVPADKVIAVSINAGFQKIFNESALLSAIKKEDRNTINFKVILDDLGVKDIYNIETEAERINKEFINKKRKEFKDI
ncbi:MAG: hypothetical protein AB1765_10920 [Candidatus Hydrogenedentota bacterium]